MKFDYTRTPEYKNILTQAVNSLRKKRQLLEFDSKTSRIIAETVTMRTGLSEAYKAYMNSYRNKIEKQMQELAEKYRNQAEDYTDPQLEILRRQDFDLEVSMWDKNEALAQLQDEYRTFSNYELKKLRQLFGTDMAVRGEIIRLEADKPSLEKDEKYQDLSEQMAVLNTIRNAGLRTIFVYNPATNTSHTLDLELEENTISDIDNKIRDIQIALTY
ncbi:hypothetical protein PWH33_07985 [Streptococcus suis]|uniref:hypothetical protein n=1 Tax=Streptococcus suis TaxID=1307 RepID=UPI003F886A56